MSTRFRLVLRSLFAAALAVFAAGCGRSDLLDYLSTTTDGGPGGDDGPGPDSYPGDDGPNSDGYPGDDGPGDATLCGPENCAGCCDSDGLCEFGGSVTSCGNQGFACQDCLNQGANACLMGSCTFEPPTCGSSCRGCCSGNVCLPGQSLTSCGTSGASCQDCAVFAETCGPISSGGGACQMQPTCGPGTCNGCCVGNVCEPGTAAAACGSKGQACGACQAFGDVCVQVGPAGGGICVVGPPQCGPSNCKGCCQGQSCLPGDSPTACGLAGGQCTNCQFFGETCNAGGSCSPPSCGPTNCAGCCDANGLCQPGFIDTECGGNGTSCQNCAGMMSVCDNNVTPRTCQDEQKQCPSPYAGCPAGLMQSSPPTEKVCPATDLGNAAAACEFGASTAGCVAFFQFEQKQRPACASCLAPFDYDFNQELGVIDCVAPFLGTTCNHELACLVNCADSTCAQCQGQAATSQCQSQASSQQCAAFDSGAMCAQAALTSGPGAFCAPGSSFGAWLQTVGTHYCAR